ncbi:MAG TPA: potassium transporter Kup, partial [Burkholderiaceae bacterium]
VAEADRVRLQQLTPEIASVALHFGFREDPDVPAALRRALAENLQLDSVNTTYFVARSMVVEGSGCLPSWRAGLFGWMTRQSESAASYFRLPANQVVELGTQVLL